ncbi:MAG TPA: hypothetical protein PLD23_10395 [Armatimonadota bacterium]|nr:hypothetical protein [Armatimonadota bacterium]
MSRRSAKIAQDAAHAAIRDAGRGSAHAAPPPGPTGATAHTMTRPTRPPGVGGKPQRTTEHGPKALTRAQADEIARKAERALTGEG